MTDKDKDVLEILKETIHDEAKGITISSSMDEGDLIYAIIAVLEKLDSSMTVGDLIKYLEEV